MSSSKPKTPKSPGSGAAGAPLLDTSKGKELKLKDMKDLTDLIQAQNGGAGGGVSFTADPVLQKKVNALKNIQLDMVRVEAKFYDELHELECKYSKLYEPFFEKRKKIVTGEYEPNETEGKWALDEEDEEAAKTESDAKKAIEPAKGADTDAAKKEEKGIVNFWLDTLQSFRITAELIQEIDEPVLAYLQDISVRLFDKQPYGYALDFHFGENPYFTNKVLTKTYELTTEIDAKDPFSFEGPDLAKSIGCKIDWKEGKNVTVKLVKKKLKSKNKKAPPKIITKEEEQESFFNFFKSLDAKSTSTSKALVKHNGGGGDEDDDDDLDEEDSEELMRIADFEIGQYLREKVVPKAVLYYSGELDGMEDEYDDEFEDEDGDGDEDGDDDDDDDDDDEDDDDEDVGKKGKAIAGKPHGKSSGKVTGGQKSGGGGGGGTEQTPAECKQS